MNVTIEELAPCRRRIRIEVPVNEVNAEIDRVTGLYQQEVKVPGFRPGKAPRDIVAKKYIKEIDEETQRRLMPKAYQQAVKDHKLRIVAGPQVEDMKFERGISMSFAAIVELAPDFKLPDYKGLTIKTEKEEVSEEELEQRIQQLREEQADFQDVKERAVQQGDYAILSFKSTVDGQPLLEVAPQARAFSERENLWVLVDENSFLPGFALQLVGAQLGEKRDVNVTFAEDFPHEPLRGKNAVFSCEVTGLKAKQLPEINDEFAKEFGAENVEKFREGARNAAQRVRTQHLAEYRRNQVTEALINSVSFELPEALVQREVKSVIREIVNNSQQRGVDPSLVEDQKDKIYDMASKSGRDRVKLSFILLRIAEEEKIEVTEAEFRGRIAAMAQQFGMTEKKLIEELSKGDSLGGVEEEILIAKTLDFLLSHAKLETV